MDDWIAENLKECTVRLQGVDGELGTGFFVAPGLVLTCFHVVKTTHAQKQIILAEWQNQQFNASVEALPSNPEIVDLALLKLENAPHTHLWVTFDVNPAVGDELYTFGYTRDYLNGEPATFECEGFDGNNPPLMKFKAGQVQSGLSGSAIINQKTGKVCGVVKRSRDVDFDLGGRAVPISVVFTAFPELCQQQPTISINNPFLPLNGRVEEPELFFGREKECDRIFETLNSGSSVAIIGERGVGKSSLLLAVKRHAETRLIQPRKAVPINLNDIYDENDFYEALCHEVGIETCKGSRLTRGLRQQCDRILLILDEIERMNCEGFTRQVREQLRGLAEGGDAPLRMVVAASTSLNQLFPDSHEIGMTSPFQGIFMEETISRWDERDMRLLINKRLQLTPIRFREEEIVQVINASRGHPRDLMQMCNRIYKQYRGK
jgi:Trypsin-like peptidase domain/AAA domain